MAQNVFLCEGSGGTIVKLGQGSEGGVRADFVTGGAGIARGEDGLDLNDLSAPNFRWMSKPYTPAGEAAICLFRRLYFAIRHNAGYCFKVRTYVDGAILTDQESTGYQDAVVFGSASTAAGTPIEYLEVPIHGRGTNLQVLLQTGKMAPGLAISATAEKFKTANTTYYYIDGTPFKKDATDSVTFTAADTINTGAAAGTYWGIWLVQLSTLGAFSTKSPASDQTYATEALAIAALPTADTDTVGIGYITVNSNEATAWTANTDDLTDASDCVEANFTDTTYNTPGDFSLEGFAIGYRRERGALLDIPDASAD
jgi:hypothetical protein